MTSKEIQDQHPEVFQKIGGIIYNLNRIEISVVTALSLFFADKLEPNSEKTFIFNDALFDKGVFPTFENKRCLLLKVIKNLWRVAEEHKIPFDKDRWLALCKSIERIQKVRNQIAHRFVGIMSNGKVRYEVRKGTEERLDDQRDGKQTGTTKVMEIDLDKDLEESMHICSEADKFIFEFLPEANKILHTQAMHLLKTRTVANDNKAI